MAGSDSFWDRCLKQKNNRLGNKHILFTGPLAVRSRTRISLIIEDFSRNRQSDIRTTKYTVQPSTPKTMRITHEEAEISRTLANALELRRKSPSGSKFH